MCLHSLILPLYSVLSTFTKHFKETAVDSVYALVSSSANALASQTSQIQVPEFADSPCHTTGGCYSNVSMSSLNSSHWTSTFCLFIRAFFLFLFTPAHILVQVLIRVGGERDLTLGESTIIEMCLRHHIWVCGCTRCVCLCVCMCALCQLWLASGTLDVRVKDTFTLQA